MDRLSQGISVVIDNTNITSKKRRKYFEMAEKAGAQVKAVVFEPDVKRAIKQNNMRERKVPVPAILKMAADYQKPDLKEGFVRIIDANSPKGLYGDQAAVFLDRDGVIFPTHVNGKAHFVNSVKDIIYLKNSFSGLKKIQEKGYDLFLASNQGGVGLGKMTMEALNKITDKIKEDVGREGICFKGIYYCIHRPFDDCRCRKPKTGLLVQAAIEHGIDLAASYMVGDMTSDIEMGNRVHTTTILLKTGFGGGDAKYDAKPDVLARDILDAAEKIKPRNL
jgi:D-glycero-D-manno-heptose 1,7-bisphosphate phosphatase